MHIPLVDEHQILMACAAGMNALTLVPELLGVRRTQLYYEKIQRWGLQPVFQLFSLEALQIIRSFAPACLLLDLSQQTTQASCLLAELLPQLPARTHLLIHRSEWESAFDIPAEQSLSWIVRPEAAGS